LEDLKERYLSFVEHQHGIVTKQIHFAHFTRVWGESPNSHPNGRGSRPVPGTSAGGGRWTCHDKPRMATLKHAFERAARW
jgi:hypothetical protein